MASLIGFEPAGSQGQGAPGDRRRADAARATPIGRAARRPSYTIQAEAEHDRTLARLIEGEIIPRLLAAHGVPCAQVASAPVAEITADEVAVFAPLSLRLEADELIDHVEAIRARGVSVDSLLVDLLAPAARLLGEYWESDRCDFVDVTMGLWRLQEVVHELRARVPARSGGCGWRALFASMPGDQHSFGTVVVDELFAREGWSTERMSEVETPDLLERIGSEWFDLVGLTISCDCHIAEVPGIIRAVRSVSRNPRVTVMVGGRLFVGDAALARDVGADGTAPDAKLAVKVAGELVAAVVRETVY